jgi:hypothetical protein
MSTTIEDILSGFVENEGEKKSQVPENINVSLPISTPQVTRRSNGQPLMQPKELPMEDMESVQQGKSIFDVIDRLYKPDEIDEDRLRNNRTIGMIGDSVKLLAQMYGAGKGAYIRENDPKDSLTTYFSNDENKIRDLYRKNQDAYKQIRMNALMREYDLKASQKEQLSREKRQNEQNAAKMAFNLKQLESKEKLENQRAIQQQSNFEAKLKADTADRNIKNAISKERLTKKSEGEGNGNPKKDYTSLSAAAMMDKEFMNMLPDEFFSIRKDPYSKKLISKDLNVNASILGAAYEQYLEQKKNAESPKQQAGEQGIYMPPLIPYRWGYDSPKQEESNFEKNVGW